MGKQKTHKASSKVFKKKKNGTLTYKRWLEDGQERNKKSFYGYSARDDRVSGSGHRFWDNT